MTPSRWTDLERPPLDVRAVQRALVDYGIWRDVRVVDETGSTNADVAALARSGSAAGLVVVAEHQTSGRGRLNRLWVAPPRSGLTSSMLLRPGDVTPDVMPHLRAGLPPLAPTAVLPARWPLLPLLVGVGVATALAAVADVEVGLKWPNDVMIGDRKVAGILAERIESASGSPGAAVVVGVGLNVTLRESELPVPTATSLALAGASCTDRDTLLKAVMRAVGDEYLGWRRVEGDGERSLLPRYRDLCVTLGRDVSVDLGGDSFKGRAVDVNSDGSLVVETPDGRRSVTAGDVVHLR